MEKNKGKEARDSPMEFRRQSHCTKSTKLIWFQFKFQHRKEIPFLKIGKKENNNCTFCHRCSETIHLFWWSNVKPRPNDRNMSTQHIATLLASTCCARLATMLRRVATCWVLLTQI